MRCNSLQALWGSAPPQHEVTAVLGLELPLSIWTGAADGAIVLWRFSPKPSTDKAVWPFALLCGHTAPISHLEICRPSDHFWFEEQQLSELHKLDTITDSSRDETHDSVVSICVEGFMCVWDGQTGHCRRRRKLPSWVGKPLTVASFPNAHRFFCICSNGPSSGQEGRKLGSPGLATPFDRTGTKLSPKGILVVVDSLTLTVMQVVYNGSLGIGAMNAMTIVPQNDTNMILVSDIHGKLRAWPGVVIDSGREGVWEGAHEDKSEHVSISAEALAEPFWSERAEAVSISTDGMLVLVVFRSRWILRSVEDGTVITEKVCIGDSIEFGDGMTDQSHCFWAGGLFLPDDSSCLDRGSVQRLVVWTSDGAAVLYYSRESDQMYSAYCTLPPIEESFRGRLKSHYCCVNDILVRSDSLWPGSEVDPVLETRLTAWPLAGLDSPDLSLHSEGLLVSLGDAETCYSAGLWSDWLKASSTGDVCGTPVVAWERPRNQEGESENGWGRSDCKEGEDKTSSRKSLTKSGSLDEAPGSHELLDRNLFVCATMLLSGSSLVPSMLVYGYGSGEIRMVELEAIEPVDSTDSYSPDHIFKQRARYFVGHTAPVLSLAEHHMTHFGRVLISGSMDSTVCVWDLREKGAPLTVLHHHVAPVRQMVLPPPGTMSPWSRCFITVGDDACVAVVSLDTLQVVRMFPGHPFLPKMIAWDHHRGYVAVLCPHPDYGQNSDVLYIWDIHSGARERILRGAAAHSMYAHFSARIRAHSASASSIVGGNATSASSLLPSADELTPRAKCGNAGMFMPADAAYMDLNESSTEVAEVVSVDADVDDIDPPFAGLRGSLERLSVKVAHVLKTSAKPEAQVTAGAVNFIAQGKAPHMLLHMHQPIKGACPMPGVAALQFDLLSLMASNLEALSVLGKLSSSNQEGMQKVHMMDGFSSDIAHNTNEHSSVKGQSRRLNRKNTLFPRADTGGRDDIESPSWLVSTEGRLLRMSLSFLHLWGVDTNVDHLLIVDLHVYQPEHVGVGLGLGGDRGAMTLFLPSQVATYELWRTSSEFCAIRSLTLVSLAQRLILLSKPASYACSELAGFYSRGLAEKLSGVISPCLEVYASFWQDPSEHVRMAARTLFHCAAIRAAPAVLRATDSTAQEKEGGDGRVGNCGEDDGLRRWLESSDGQYWTVMLGGTEQDGRAARIIVAASLAVWYPTIVRPDLARMVAPLLLQLVQAAKDRHVASVAEILAEGMTSTWHDLIASQSRHFMVQVFDQIENLSNVGGATENGTYPAPAVAMAIRESLAGNLLPSLAMADVTGFLHVAHNQLEATASDSPVHRVSLSVLIRCIRGAPKAVLPHLGQVTSLILQTLEAGNYSLRKQCMQSAMAAVREIVRVFPMVALHPGSSTSNPKLAVGDPVGDVRTLAIHVYDLHSMSTLKVLDASGPPGHPALLSSSGSAASISGISALAFSNDGEGLVAFSQNGLVIRWWSLGAVWWERLSRTHVPVQCTKLVLVPPWAGFSPRSSSSSLMHIATLGHRSNHSSTDDSASDQESPGGHERRPSDDSALKLAYLALDLSYRLEWQAEKVVVLQHHGQELGSFQL